MRRLRDFQHVTLVIDGRRMPSTVVATSAHRVWLEPERELTTLRHDLPAPARVVFTHDHGLVMLTGTADLDPSGCVVFASDDRGRVKNQRHASRLAISLHAKVTPQDADRPATVTATTTTDVSPGGLLLSQPFLAAKGTLLNVVIELPGDLNDIEATCRVVRADSKGTALQFVAIPGGEIDRLQSIVIAVRRRIARARRPAKPVAGGSGPARRHQLSRGG